MMGKVEFDGDVYDARHGGAFDRGSADSYYGRGKRPHYFVGATYQSDEIIPKQTDPEYWEYLIGYDYNEQFGDKKDWN
jgi:hypothetical protein